MKIPLGYSRSAITESELDHVCW